MHIYIFTWQVAVVDIVSEKESKMKIVQNVYGLTPITYWCRSVRPLVTHMHIINHADPSMFDGFEVECFQQR